MRLNMDLPDEGMMFYEIEGEEGCTMWTVLHPKVANCEDVETVLQKTWLSKEELEGFVGFEWDDERPWMRQVSPKQRGLSSELISAFWTENAENEFRWFLEVEDNGAKMLQRSWTRLERNEFVD